MGSSTILNRHHSWMHSWFPDPFNRLEFLPTPACFDECTPVIFFRPAGDLTDELWPIDEDFEVITWPNIQFIHSLHTMEYKDLHVRDQQTQSILCQYIMFNI